MGDAEIDEEEGGLPAAEGGGGTSPIIKWLLYVAGAIFGIIIVAVIAMIVAKETATKTFTQMKNVALVKPLHL